MKVSKREENKIKCRQNIFKVSRILFNKKGYDETMVDEIAETAGVSKATFYNYFPTKECLLNGTAEHEMEHIRYYLEHDLKDIEDSDLKLKKMIEYLITDCLPYINLSRRLVYLNACNDREILSIREDLMEITEGLIKEAMAQGRYKEGYTVSDIADIYTGLFLVTHFKWPDIESYSEEKLKNMLNRLFDVYTADIYG